MTTDLWMLAASVLLTWLLIMADAGPKIVGNGMTWASGNREETPEQKGLPARIGRTSANMQENLPLFGLLVLVVHVSGNADATSALGAQVFFAARVAHAAVYIAGIAYVRTALWAVSIVGMFMIASTLLG